MRGGIWIGLLGLLATSCTTTYPVGDFAAFYERQPNTLLVLPVINETTSAEAPAAFHSTIASPLIQRGYSVFPVLPSLAVLRAEGVYEGEQLRNTPPQIFKDLLGADAVLYVSLHTWDTVYMVLASGVKVSMTYELIDTETGETMWKDQATRTVQSDSSGGLLAAMINAAITAMSTKYVGLARQANTMALAGLPAGPLHVNFEKERTRYLEIAAKRAEKERKEAEKAAAKAEG